MEGEERRGTRADQASPARATFTVLKTDLSSGDTVGRAVQPGLKVTGIGVVSQFQHRSVYFPVSLTTPRDCRNCRGRQLQSCGWLRP